MSLEEFVSNLDLGFDGKYSNNEYVIMLNNSDDFSNVFSKISLNKSLDADDESIATENQSFFIYSDGYFEIELSANYDKDVYIIIIRRR